MGSLEKTGNKKKVTNTVMSRVKNQELVLKMQLHIAKKASKLFIKKGYHKTSIRDLSEATGMAVGSLYNYIKKKEDVLCLVFDVFHRSLREYLEKQGVYNIEDPEEQFKAYICRLLENAQNFRDEIIFMYTESWLLPQAFKEIFMQKELDNILNLEKIVKRGIDQGAFRVEYPFYTASTIIYQLSIEPLRGWTFTGKYSIEEINRMTADHILKMVIN